MPTPGEDFRVQCEQNARRWDEVFNKDDAAEIAKLYGPEARLLPAGSPAITNDTDIQQFWDNMIKKGFSQHKITVQGAEARGGMGYVYGRWQVKGSDEGGGTKQYEGNWLNVVERHRDEWRTVLHSWN